MAQSYQSKAESRTTDTLQDKVHELKSKAEDAASTVAAEGAKALKSAEKSAEDAYAATKRFVEEQPLLAVGAAAALAFAIGALWKMTPSRRSYGYDFLDRFADYVEPQYRALRRRW